MNYWLVVGSPQNWHTAFEQGNIWGLKETQHRLWKALNEEDKLLFYATSPVRGIIGYGVVRTKLKQNKPLWPDELKVHKVIWPWRFEFDVESCLPPDKWASGKMTSKELWPRSGFQLLDPSTGEKLASAMGVAEYVHEEIETLKISEPTAEYTGATEKTEKVISSHDQAQKTLIQIGKIQNYIAESEYPFDIGKLDVVWRRVPNSVPTYVFEIQVGGDVYHALAKLKHAFDLWNSHIFIVAHESDHIKVNSLLSGTFHEINNRINFIELAQVEELYKRKKSYRDFEKELGI
jgi:predicted RNA-binding protein